MMDKEKFKRLLLDLKVKCNVRVAGSFANGTYDSKGKFSDIDFVVKYASCSDLEDKRRETPIKRAIRIFEEYGIEWDSAIIGAISSPRDAITLPRPIEVMSSSWITPDPTYPPTVTLFGIEFKTFKRDFR